MESKCLVCFLSFHSYLDFFFFLMKTIVCEEEGPFAEESGCMFGCMYVTLEVLPILETLFQGHVHISRSKVLLCFSLYVQNNDSLFLAFQTSLEIALHIEMLMDISRYNENVLNGRGFLFN